MGENLYNLYSITIPESGIGYFEVGDKPPYYRYGELKTKSLVGTFYRTAELLEDDKACESCCKFDIDDELAKDMNINVKKFNPFEYTDDDEYTDEGKEFIKNSTYKVKPTRDIECIKFSSGIIYNPKIRKMIAEELPKSIYEEHLQFISSGYKTQPLPV